MQDPMIIHSALSRFLLPIALFASLALAACGAASEPEPAALDRPTTDPDAQVMVVHKTPWCGCCTVWAEQAEAAGFTVEMRDHDDLGPIKQALGVPAGQGSCHTAEIGGYFVEGHVPFEQITRLLQERPEGAAGIAVPGMPLGSPGMEYDGIEHDYSVNLVGRDGSVQEYATYPVRD